MEGEVKRLNAELKRLKKAKDLDKDEIEYDSNGNDTTVEFQPCVHCKTGFMTKIFVVGRNFWQCSSCKKTCKV